MSFLGWCLVLMSAGLAVMANLLMRAGVDRAGGFGGDLASIHWSLWGLVCQPRFDLGLALYVLASLVWFKVLSSEPLSVAYPVMTSITFLLVSVGGVVLFREALNAYKIVGVLVILLGIVLISRS